MTSCNRFVGSPSRRSLEQVHETRFVRIAHGAFAVWLDPFGMLDPQIVVNLLPELGVSVDFVRQSHRLGERFNCGAGRSLSLALPVSSLSSKTNEFHKRLFIWG